MKKHINYKLKNEIESSLFKDIIYKTRKSKKPLILRVMEIDSLLQLCCDAFPYIITYENISITINKTDIIKYSYNSWISNSFMSNCERSINWKFNE